MGRLAAILFFVIGTTLAGSFMVARAIVNRG